MKFACIRTKASHFHSQADSIYASSIICLRAYLIRLKINLTFLASHIINIKYILTFSVLAFGLQANTEVKNPVYEQSQANVVEQSHNGPTIIEKLVKTIESLESRKKDLQERVELLEFLSSFIFSKLSPAQKKLITENIQGGHLKHSHNLFNYTLQNHILLSGNRLYRPDIIGMSQMKRRLNPFHTFSLPIFTLPALQRILEYNEIQLKEAYSNLNLALEKSPEPGNNTQKLFSPEKSDIDSYIIYQNTLPTLLSKKELFEAILQFPSTPQDLLKEKEEAQEMALSVLKNHHYILSIVNIWKGLNSQSQYILRDDRRQKFQVYKSANFHSNLEIYFKFIQDPLRNLYFPYLTDVSEHYKRDASNFGVGDMLRIHVFPSRPGKKTYNISSIKPKSVDFVKIKKHIQEHHKRPNEVLLVHLPWSFLLNPDHPYLSREQILELLELIFPDITPTQIEETKKQLTFDPYTVLLSQEILAHKFPLKLQLSHALAGPNREWAKTIYAIYKLKYTSDLGKHYAGGGTHYGQKMISTNSDDPTAVREPNYAPFKEHLITHKEVLIPDLASLVKEEAPLPPLSVLLDSYNTEDLAQLPHSRFLQKYMDFSLEPQELLDLINIEHISRAYPSSSVNALNALHGGELNRENLPQRWKYFPHDVEITSGSLKLGAGSGIPQYVKEALIEYIKIRDKIKLFESTRRSLVYSLDSRLENTPEDYPYIIWLYQNYSTSLPNSGRHYVHLLNTLPPAEREDLFNQFETNPGLN